MAARAVQACCVCATQSPKYRCPGCRLRYCSVPCCKTHKEECVPKSKTLPEVAPPGVSPAFRGFLPSGNDENDWYVDDILGEDDGSDTVPLEKLKRLGESKELKDLLLNPHLAQLLVTVDQTDGKEAAMKKYMQEPLMVEFADCCLRIVEPPDSTNPLTSQVAQNQKIQDLLLQ